MRATERFTDNSNLLPKYVPDSQVALDDNDTPDWASGLVMTAVNPHNATREGTFSAMLPLLDHIREMGVNGLWLCPVYDRGKTADGRLAGNGYSNMGPDTIDPSLTGTDDYAKGWKVLHSFIEEAHRRDIRVFLDVISWGTVGESPLRTFHPDWYTGDTEWGGYLFDWTNEEFREWYICQVVNIALLTGCDGFRYDLEPMHAGYEVDGEIKRRLLSKGRKLLMIGERINERRKAYDFDQFSVTGPDGEIDRALFDFLETNPFLSKYDLAYCVKQGLHIGTYESQSAGEGGALRYYTNMLSSHDSMQYVVKKNRLAIGYQAIFSPFIPLWYIGEECGAEKQSCACVLFDTPVDIDGWLADADNRAFYEDVKAMLRIRRTYKEVFEYYPEHFYSTNICKVSKEGGGNLGAYARFSEGTALIIIPNSESSDRTAHITVRIPFDRIGLDGSKEYTVTDVFTGKVLIDGIDSKNNCIGIDVPRFDAAVLAVKADKGMFKENK